MTTRVTFFAAPMWQQGTWRAFYLTARVEAERLIANIDSKTGEFIDGKIHSFIQQRSRGPQPDTKNIVAAEIRSLTKSDIKDQLLDITDDGTITRKK